MKKHVVFLLLSINVASCFAMESNDTTFSNSNESISHSKCSAAIARAVGKNMELDKEKKQLEQEIAALKEAQTKYQNYFAKLTKQTQDARDHQTVAEHERDTLRKQLDKEQEHTQTLMTLYTNHLAEYITIQQQQNNLITRIFERQEKQWCEHKELMKTQLALFLYNSSYKRGTFFDEEGIDDVEFFTNNQIMGYLRSLVKDMQQLQTPRRVPLTTPAPPNTPKETLQFELSDLNENQ